MGLTKRLGSVETSATNSVFWICVMQGRRRGEQAQRHIYYTAVALFVLLLTIAFVIGTHVSSEFERARDARELLNRSFAATTHKQNVFSLLQDAESGQRGFIITGDDRFLSQYGTALDRLPQEVTPRLVV